MRTLLTIFLAMSKKLSSPQASVQQFMTLYRIFALCVMYVTLGIKLHADWDILPHRASVIGTCA